MAAVLAGTCYVLVGIFHPPNVCASATTTRWEIVHVLACAMCFFGLLGITGLYRRKAAKTGWVGLGRLSLAHPWFDTCDGFQLRRGVRPPAPRERTPAFVHSWMGMFNSHASTFGSAPSPPSGTQRADLHLGGLLFGIATFRAGILPRWAGALLALSVRLAPVAVLLPNASQPKIAVPFGVALAWLGYALLSERRTDHVAAVVPPQDQRPKAAA